jgi:hypothetical protein
VFPLQCDQIVVVHIRQIIPGYRYASSNEQKGAGADERRAAFLNLHFISLSLVKIQ